MRPKTLFSLLLIFVANTTEVKTSEIKAPETFETERLRAHRIQEKDFDNWYLLLSNTEVAKTGFGGAFTFDQAKEFMDRSLQRWSKYGYGTYIFHDKSGNFIGRAGLHPFPVDGNDEIILSYSLMPEYWNKGLATEMGKSVAKIGFELHKFKSIVGFTQPINGASRRVMEKNGFKYEKNILEKTGPYNDVDLVFYRLINENH